MESYFLGIDGGGTKCRARLTDYSGRVLGEGRAGPANTTLGIDKAFEAILEATNHAIEEADLDQSIYSRLHAGIGLAGLPNEGDLDELIEHDHPFASVRASTDAYIACLGAHRGEDGGILILGTGSCGFGIIGDRYVTVSGWGFQLGDQASGAYIGIKAARGTFQVYDGVLPPSTLADEILERFDNCPEKAVAWSLTATPGDYGALAPIVSRHAASGDHMAIVLMNESAHQADLIMKAMYRKGIKKIACLGGFYNSLKNWLPKETEYEIVSPVGDALDGAMMMARRGVNNQLQTTSTRLKP